METHSDNNSSILIIAVYNNSSINFSLLILNLSFYFIIFYFYFFIFVCFVFVNFCLCGYFKKLCGRAGRQRWCGGRPCTGRALAVAGWSCAVGPFSLGQAPSRRSRMAAGAQLRNERILVLWMCVWLRLGRVCVGLAVAHSRVSSIHAVRTNRPAAHLPPLPRPVSPAAAPKNATAQILKNSKRSQLRNHAFIKMVLSRDPFSIFAPVHL